jgi:hypothetical protein
LSRPPYPPYPPFPPYPPPVSQPPYPPYPPYPATVISAGSAAPTSAAPPSAGTPAPPATPTVQPPPATQPPGNQPEPPKPLSVFFNYGRYDVLDSTNEGLGQGQLAKLNEWAVSAAKAGARSISVDGYASPEDNLANSQLPLNRATAVKNKLDALFSALFAANPSSAPTITTRTTNVLSGDSSTWPQLRRADVYIVS